jgi:hypothetical protein
MNATGKDHFFNDTAWWAVIGPAVLSWIAFGLFAVTHMVTVHNAVLQGVYVRIMLLMSLMSTSRYFTTSWPKFYEYVLLVVAFEKAVEFYILFLFFGLFAMWAWVNGDVHERLVRSRATYSRHFFIVWHWGALYGSGDQCLRSLRLRVAQAMVLVPLARFAGFLMVYFVKPDNIQLGRWLFLTTTIMAVASLILALVTIFRFYRAFTGSEPLALDQAPADAESLAASVKEAPEPRQGEPVRGPVQGEPGAPDAAAAPTASAAAPTASLASQAQDAHELPLAGEQQPPPQQQQTADTPRAAEEAAAPGTPRFGEVPSAGADASPAQPAQTTLTDGLKNKSRQSTFSFDSPPHTASLLVGMNPKRKFLIIKIYMWVAVACSLLLEPLIIVGGVTWVPHFLCPNPVGLTDEQCAARFSTYVNNWIALLLQISMLWAYSPQDALSLPKGRQLAYSENLSDSTWHAVLRIFYFRDVWFMCARPPACCVASSVPPTRVVLASVPPNIVVIA